MKRSIFLDSGPRDITPTWLDCNSLEKEIRQVLLQVIHQNPNHAQTIQDFNDRLKKIMEPIQIETLAKNIEASNTAELLLAQSRLTELLSEVRTHFRTPEKNKN